MVKAVVAIDDDVNFLDKLRLILDDLGLLGDFEFCPILARGQTPSDVSAQCITEITDIVRRRLTIAIVLVDIVNIERGEPPSDRSGLEVAKEVNSYLPSVPIVGITRYIKSDRILSEVSLDPYLEGILSKAYLEDTDFSRRQFLEIISKATVKLRFKRQIGSSGADQSLPKAVEGRFTIQDDPRCRFQALQIGENTLMVLLESLFTSGHGTVKYLRPGFSGSYLFKAAVKTAEKGKSPSSVRKWVIKVSDNERKLGEELQKCTTLKARIEPALYPQLLKEELQTFDGWAAVAFELQEDAVTLHEYLNRIHSKKGLLRLIDKSLIPFLREHYGDPVKKQCFLWKEFYTLDDRVKAGVLNFTGEAHTLIPERLAHSYKPALARIENFINGQTERSIYDLDDDFDTRLIHGDLHSRNILVAGNGARFVFIDFANSKQDHYMKDIAKLETDIVFQVMDSKHWNHTDWESVSRWSCILGLYKRGSVFTMRPESNERNELNPTIDLILALRKGLKAFDSQPAEDQYLIALFHYTLKVLSYPDITVQKKVFAVQFLDVILNAISAT